MNKDSRIFLFRSLVKVKRRERTHTEKLTAARGGAELVDEKRACEEEAGVRDGSLSL